MGELIVWFWDHPRVSGEHFRAFEQLIYAPGSSPRERGALVDATIVSEPFGIIPA